MTVWILIGAMVVSFVLGHFHGAFCMATSIGKFLGQACLAKPELRTTVEKLFGMEI